MGSSKSKKATGIPFPVRPPGPAVADGNRLRTWLRDWLVKHRIVSSAEEWRRIDRWQIQRFTQLIFPACRTRDEAELTCAWVAWLHRFDDEFAQPAVSHDPAAAEQLATPYLETLVAARATQSATLTARGGLLGAFIELNSWTVSPMGQPWRRRWFDDLEDYIRACITESSHRAEGVPLTPEKLIELKRVAMCQRPCLLLGERVETGELSPEARYLCSPLGDAVIDITAAQNDLASLDKERACGDVHNAILSLMHHHSVSEDAASHTVETFMRQRCKDLLHMMQNLPSAPEIRRERDIVYEFMATGGYWARGHYEWVAETGRWSISSYRNGC